MLLDKAHGKGGYLRALLILPVGLEAAHHGIGIHRPAFQEVGGADILDPVGIQQLVGRPHPAPLFQDDRHHGVPGLGQRLSKLLVPRQLAAQAPRQILGRDALD